MSNNSFIKIMPTVAKLLLGEPNKSTKRELRYGTRGSLAIDLKKGTYFDHEANEGGGVLDLIEREKGLKGAALFDWLRENGFELGATKSKKKIVAVYDYTDEQGALLFQVVRYQPKDFRQRRPDPSAPGGYRYSVKGVRQVPFNLPALRKAITDGRVVLIPEGEKDVLASDAKLDITATCNAGGAGKAKNGKSKWRDELNPHFAGADVVLMPDNDAVGRAHAAQIAAKLKTFAERIRILDLAKHWPECPPGGDLSDWIEAGGTKEKFDALIAIGPDWGQTSTEWDALIERARQDKGAPFETEVVTALAELKKDRRAEFERVLGLLKDAGVRVSELEKEIAKESNDRGGGRTAAERLIDLGTDTKVELFHALDAVPYADINVNSSDNTHRATWPIRSKGFKSWLVRNFFEETGGAPNNEALQTALNLIEATASFKGPERAVYNRVAEHAGRIYLDLGDDTWSAIEIDADGWRIIQRPPVRFRRAAGVRPLPTPVRGGSIALLRRFINVRSKGDFVLVVAWLLASFRSGEPYPLLVIIGEHGTAKSTIAKIIRLLVDPNAAPLRNLPREGRDLFVAAGNGHVLAFDNVSNLPSWLSDDLCRLSTGAGSGTRQLFTDDEEALFSGARPIILNGIDNVVARPDLAERALILDLAPISKRKRRTEKAFWAAFQKKYPLILGALLDAVAHGLAHLPRTQLKDLPRMADFATWAAACETSFCRAGTFIEAYTGNREEAIETTLSSDLVAAALRAFIAARTEWTGTATDLLDALNALTTEAQRKRKTWPDSPRALSNRLRRAATFLRTVGINILFGGRAGKKRDRLIHIFSEPLETRCNSSSASSASSACPEKTSENSGLEANDRADDRADDSPAKADPAVCRPPSQANGTGTAADSDSLDPHLRQVNCQLAAEAKKGVAAVRHQWRAIDSADKTALRAQYADVHLPAAHKVDSTASDPGCELGEEEPKDASGTDFDAADSSFDSPLPSQKAKRP
jgi:hypothetical protein